MRQKIAQLRADLNHQIPVFRIFAETDVYVQAEDQQLVGHSRHVIKKACITLPGGKSLLAPVSKRMSAGRGDGHAVLNRQFPD